MSYSSPLGQLVQAPTLRTTYMPAPPVVTDAQAEAARQADIAAQMAAGETAARARVVNMIAIGGIGFLGLAGLGGWLFYRAKHKAAVKTNRRRMRRNPVPHGYSRKTMGKIIGIERRSGKSPKQAAAIAYSIARKAARRAGKHPSYLRRTA